MSSEGFAKAYSSIRGILENARSQAFYAVNTAMVKAYWEIGRVIVEEEQKGKSKARYGERLLDELSKRLMEDYGRGFDESNLRYIRLFYLKFPIRDALRHELTWTHYRLLLRQESKLARGSIFRSASIPDGARASLRGR